MIPDRSSMGPFIVMGTLLVLVVMKDLRTLREIEMLIKSMWRKQSISSVWVKLLFVCLYIHKKKPILLPEPLVKARSCWIIRK